MVAIERRNSTENDKWWRKDQKVIDDGKEDQKVEDDGIKNVVKKSKGTSHARMRFEK